jgi:hypothetical protein
LKVHESDFVLPRQPILKKGKMKIEFGRPLFLALAIGASCFGSRSLLGQSVTFSTNDFGTGLGPYSIAAADVLGTGRPAIITANQNDSTLTVLGNFGNGTLFVSNASYAVSSSPRCVVAVDVNGDSKVDLISVGVSATTVLTNNNFRSFGWNSTITTGGNCAVTINLNNDGISDLLIGGNTSVRIYTNNGTGHFGIATNLSVTGTVYSMATADVNADGRLDLIVANYNDGTLTVFTNNGSGALVSNATYSAGSFVRSVAAADINGDGHPDLIAANISSATLTILTNNGTGTFGSNATVAVLGCYSVVAGDFNGDGLTDLIAIDGSRRPGILSVVTNSSTGFGPYFTITAGQESQAMAVADFNGDNKPDLVLGNTVSSITVLLNSTQFVPPPLNIVSAGNQSVLYWRSPSASTVLQATVNLTNPNWFTVTNGAAIQGVTLPVTSPALFFRLESQ